jgi:hypothetical protein
MEAHSLGLGDSFDEAVEEPTAIALTALVGMLSLSLQDRDELGTGLEEPAALADALEGTAEKSGPRAVTVGEVSMMVARGLLAARACRSNWGSA